MFMRLSERGSFGHPVKFRSAINAGLKKDKYTVLLMHMDGENDSVIFKDSANDKIITPVNVVTKTTEKMFGTASAFFSNGALSIPSSDDFYLDGDFTIDFWFNSSLPNSMMFFGRSADNSLGGGDLYLYYNGSFKIGGWGTEIVTGVTASPNVWNHLALIKDGNLLKLAINGVFGYSAEKAIDYANAGNFIIGDNYNVNYFVGYMDEFRVSKGIARWTDNFTPPTNAY